MLRSRSCCANGLGHGTTAARSAVRRCWTPTPTPTDSTFVTVRRRPCRIFTTRRSTKWTSRRVSAHVEPRLIGARRSSSATSPPRSRCGETGRSRWPKNPPVGPPSAHVMPGSTANGSNWPIPAGRSAPARAAGCGPGHVLHAGRGRTGGRRRLLRRIPGRNGRWAFTIGDVCGRGALAASTTGIVRHTTRAVARLLHEPLAVVDAVNTALLISAIGYAVENFVADADDSSDDSA